MNSLILSRNTEAVALSVSPEAIREKQELLDVAYKIASVTDCTVGAAVKILQSLKQTVKTVEESRTFAKRPFLEFGRKIDGIAASYAFELEVEAKRINKLLSDYQAEQQRLAAEAERRRQEEIAKFEAEKRRVAEEEARKMREAEAVRQAELKKAQEQSRLKAALLAQEQAAQRQQEAKAAAERLATEAAKVVLPVVVEAPKVQGMHTREIPHFEVQDIHLLYSFDRELVYIEPNRKNILRLIDQGIKSIPGLKIWSETVAIVRT